jgi:hypothetical protein
MFDPSTLSNKALWLRAKDLGSGGTSVATWPDQSGQTHDGTAAGTAPTVADTSTPLGGKSVRFAGSGYFNLGSVVSSPAAGELWIVVKSDGVTGPSSWEFGADSGQQSHYPYSGAVYDDAITNSRQSFTPTVPVTSWRIYRVTNDGSQWVASLDGQTQRTINGLPVAWPATFLLGTSSGGANFQGNIAEVLVRTSVSTAQESSDLLNYFVHEHFSAVTSAAIYGDYAEALTVGSSPNRLIYAAYTETLANAASPRRNIYASYSEGLTNSNVIQRQLYSSYVEVLTESAPKKRFVGWGLPL